MSIKDMLPRFGRHGALEKGAESNPLKSLQKEMNRVFEDFFEETGLSKLRGSFFNADAAVPFSPCIDVSETDKDVTVSVELPGMDKNNVTVELDDNSLVVRGEKKTQKEEKDKRWHRREQTYGSFQRVVQLPASIDATTAKANFKKGVLQVTVAKSPGEVRNRRVIDVAAD